jgi:DNA-binding transcriptional MerR regulator
MSEDLILSARKAFDRCKEHWHDNFETAKEDLRFARLEEQWPADGPGSKRQRELAGRPCETFNKLPAFVRQVVNDARQNKPQIKVHPQDSGADPRTADIINGLIRNIEVTSDADVAYDTAIECAVDRGFGYYRINTRYTCEDTFDQDIVFERVANPLTVYGDPNSTAADSSDWNEAFIVSTMTKEEFKAEYPDAELVDWESDFKDAKDWLDGENVLVAEWWSREKVKGQIVALATGEIVKVEQLASLGPVQTVGQPREVETYKVTQRIMSGAEILKEVNWAGKYIPIVPVYGDEVIDEHGKRHFLSLIRPAKGAQRMYNYMRNTGIELLALQPKVPFIGEEGAFDADPNWDKVNDQSIPYLEHAKGTQRPERQPPPQGSQAVLQEALTASDDMKAIIGIYDASLGARSNETSGVAINARQREGDVSTFHFIDNLQRAIRHGGRILLDLIPKVYSTARVIRVLGEDLQPQTAQIAPTGQPVTEERGPDGSLMHIYDITAGKYDLTVSSGPSFTTRREEMQQAITEIIQAAPVVAPVMIPELVKQMDFPNADRIAQQLEALNPANQQSQQNQLQAAVGQVQQQAGQQIQELQQKLAQLEGALKDKMTEAQLKNRELDIKEFEAQTARLKTAIDAQKPTHAPQVNQAA